MRVPPPYHEPCPASYSTPYTNLICCFEILSRFTSNYLSHLSQYIVTSTTYEYAQYLRPICPSPAMLTQCEPNALPYRIRVPFVTVQVPAVSLAALPALFILVLYEVHRCAADRADRSRRRQQEV